MTCRVRLVQPGDPVGVECDTFGWKTVDANEAGAVFCHGNESLYIPERVLRRALAKIEDAR